MSRKTCTTMNNDGRMPFGYQGGQRRPRRPASSLSYIWAASADGEHDCEGRDLIDAESLSSSE